MFPIVAEGTTQPDDCDPQPIHVRTGPTTESPEDEKSHGTKEVADLEPNLVLPSAALVSTALSVVKPRS